MWSSAKNGLVQPSKQGRTSPLNISRKRENSRDFARKQKKITILIRQKSGAYADKSKNIRRDLSFDIASINHVNTKEKDCSSGMLQHSLMEYGSLKNVLH